MADFKIAPLDKNDVINGEMLAKKLECLIGQQFPLVNKPRTDGSTLRKLLVKTLDDGSVMLADKNDYTVIPPKGKGMPRLLACLCDSYIVTSGDVYNLQVWNRFPNAEADLVVYKNGMPSIKCSDIRFIFVRIDVATHLICSIIVATPGYIVGKFGPFGVPTIKYQMIISDLKRFRIVNDDESCFFRSDTRIMTRYTTHDYVSPESKISDSPSLGRILSLDCIKKMVVDALIGTRLDAVDTKTRGQALERIVANLLGYDSKDALVGGYPDIPNQLLEIKVQDSPTVDLGKYSPTNPIVLDGRLGISTEDVRYLIALTDKTGVIEGLILSPGACLRETFNFVSGTSFKCQRSIPMSFFDAYAGRSVFNP